MRIMKSKIVAVLLLATRLPTGRSLVGGVHGRISVTRASSVVSAAAQLPTTRKETISQMTAATQAALRSRCSRMDVELPPGAHLGVEKAQGNESPLGGLFGMDVGGGGEMTGANALLTLQQSDRELARLFIEMFRPLGAESVCAVFSSSAEASAAKAAWKGDQTTRVFSLSGSEDNGKLKTKGGTSSSKGKKSKATTASLGRGGRGGGGGGGFAAKLAAATKSKISSPPLVEGSSAAAAAASAAAAGAASAAGTTGDAGVDASGGSASSSRSSGIRSGTVPPGCEVLLVVGPKGATDLACVENICRSAGQGTVVVLLNARLESQTYSSSDQQGFFLGEFEPVFQLKPPPPQAVAEARKLNAASATPIVWRAYPGNWQLSSKPAMGNAKKVAEFKERPNEETVVRTLTDPKLLAEQGATFEGQLSALLGKISAVIG